MNHRSRLRAAILCAIGASTLATDARADGAYVNPGLLFGPMWGSPGGFAYGGELSFLYYPSGNDFLGAGAFAQLQRYSGNETLTRVAGGIQAGGPAGVELGVAKRSGGETHSDTTDIHVGLYSSLAVLTVALRMGIPVAGDEHRFGFEYGIQLGIKLPIPFGEPPRFGMGSPGRALTVGLRELRAPLVCSASWT